MQSLQITVPVVCAIFAAMYLGVLLNNRGMDALDKRIDDLRDSMRAELGALRSDMLGMEHRLMAAIERLEHPIYKP